MPRDQRRSREADAEARAGHTEPNRDNVEAKGHASSMQREEGVTQRVPEVAYCLRGLAQRVLRPTQRLEGLAQCFRVVREGFMGHVF